MESTETKSAKKITADITNYLSAGFMAISALLAFTNVGGKLSGIDLMDMFFKMFPHIPSQGSKGIAMWLLFFSHIGIIAMGCIGTFFYALKRNGLIFCIGVILSGFLGLISGIIAEWNFLAELFPLILGIICLISNIFLVKK